MLASYQARRSSMSRRETYRRLSKSMLSVIQSLSKNFYLIWSRRIKDTLYQSHRWQVSSEHQVSLITVALNLLSSELMSPCAWRWNNSTAMSEPLVFVHSSSTPRCSKESRHRSPCCHCWMPNGWAIESSPLSGKRSLYSCYHGSPVLHSLSEVSCLLGPLIT